MPLASREKETNPADDRHLPKHIAGHAWKAQVSTFLRQLLSSLFSVGGAHPSNNARKGSWSSGPPGPSYTPLFTGTRMAFSVVLVKTNILTCQRIVVETKLVRCNCIAHLWAFAFTWHTHRLIVFRTGSIALHRASQSMATNPNKPTLSP